MKITRKFWKRLIIWLVAFPVLVLSIAIAILYWKQDEIVQHFLSTFNEDFLGEIEIGDSHISPFSSFPHITVDLEDVKIWEGKGKHNIQPIVEVKDLYLGFNFFSIISGKFDIDYLRAESGKFDLIRHKDGTFNVLNALSNPNSQKVENLEDEFHMHLKSIELKNLDIHKYDEQNCLDVEAYVQKAQASFKRAPSHLLANLKSDFILNVIDDGDTTLIRHKHFHVDTDLDFQQETSILKIKPSSLVMEHGDFKIDGTLDIMDSLNIDLNIHGNKPNFNLFIAFAPEELIPTLEKYDNAGNIYFEGRIKGKSVNGIPAVTLDFGCDEGWLKNTETNKSLNEMHFEGHFSNTLNDAHDLSAMEFILNDFKANPEAGFIQAEVKVKNFESPEIEMDINSDFHLDFLADFFEYRTLENLKGQVILKMKFHDIVDLSHPERSIEKLNEAYFTELSINNLSFRSPALPVPIDKVNAKIHMDGHKADIDFIDIKAGNSDLHIDGLVSDLPAIIHHTNKIVDSKLNISSKSLDIKQLTTPKSKSDSTIKAVDELIKNLSLKLDFKSSARAFTESKHLPEGEFFIKDFYAKLKNYPHIFHDFQADIYVDENDMRIVDFSGMIDTTDFHFIGKLHDYGFWFKEKLSGDTKVEFDLTSSHMRLEDLFAYKGENYVPKDYRHEEFQGLKIHGMSDLHFKEGLHSIDIRLSQVNARMKIHPLKFRNFKGRIHYEDEHIQIDTLFGEIGKSSFRLDLNYYLGDDESVRKRDNHLGLYAEHLDMDQLLNYAPTTSNQSKNIDHEAVFNIYDLPFTPMTFDLDIKHLNYHRYLIHNLEGRFRTEKNHFIRIDTLTLYAAGGRVDMGGYFDGHDRNRIYLNPKIKFNNINLDKFLFKFDNFGQDHLISENLHGEISGTLSGHIRMHPDLVPKIDESEVHLDFEVLNGRLVNYEPLVAMAEYFGDKNLASVRFDSLVNQLDIKDGKLNFPNMTLNTSLGHLDLSGSQQIGGNYEMDYYVHIPLNMVGQVARDKLFGGKKIDLDSISGPEVDEEEVVFKDESKRIRYLNLRIQGGIEDYKIKLNRKGYKRKMRKGLGS